MIGNMVTSKSCSGTCLIFSIAAPAERQRRAHRAGARRPLAGASSSTAQRVLGDRRRRAAPRSWRSCGLLLRCRPRRGGRSGRGRPRRGSAGRARSRSTPMPPRASSASGAATRSASATRRGQRGRVGRDGSAGTVERRGEDPLGLGPLLGVAQPHVQRAGADRRLELAGGALGDHLAVVDDRDPVGELVGLVEVLRGQQHRRARRRPAPGRCPTPGCGCAGRGRWSARRGTAARA